MANIEDKSTIKVVLMVLDNGSLKTGYKKDSLATELEMASIDYY